MSDTVAGYRADLPGQVNKSRMKLSDVKLRTQLGAAFFAMVLVTAGLGGFAADQLTRVNANTEDIATNWLPSVAVLGEIRAQSNGIRRAEASYVLACGDPREMEAVEKRIADSRKALADKQAVYAPLVTPGEEARAFEKLKQDLNAYFAVQAQLLALQHQGATLEQTKALYQGASRVAFTAVLEDVDHSVEINERGADVAFRSSQETYAHARRWFIALVAAAMVMSALLAVWIVRGVTRQLGGEPREAAELGRRIAAGDLSNQIKLQPGDATSMMAQLKAMQQSLADIVGGVRENADGVATASMQIAQGTHDLSQRTEEQASALEQTAASMEQLGSAVRQNADNAQQANQLALSASAVGVRGSEVMGEVVATMKGINDSSGKIAEIIGVIDGIAFQTNILALNAAVEAARAGAHGRGFAVVAGEVRSLAQRSAEAAKEIKQLITDSVERVEQGTALVGQAGATMREIVGSIQRVTDIMGEISAASAEQSDGVAQVGAAVGQMDTTTQQNAALVEQSAAAAESLKTQARDLVEAVALFKLPSSAPAAAKVAPALARLTVRDGAGRQGQAGLGAAARTSSFDGREASAPAPLLPAASRQLASQERESFLRDSRPLVASA